jgi:hypothetical protein
MTVVLASYMIHIIGEHCNHSHYAIYWQQLQFDIQRGEVAVKHLCVKPNAMENKVSLMYRNVSD